MTSDSYWFSRLSASDVHVVFWAFCRQLKVFNLCKCNQCWQHGIQNCLLYSIMKSKTHISKIIDLIWHVSKVMTSHVNILKIHSLPRFLSCFVCCIHITYSETSLSWNYLLVWPSSWCKQNSLVWILLPLAYYTSSIKSLSPQNPNLPAIPNQ